MTLHCLELMLVGNDEGSDDYEPLGYDVVSVMHRCPKLYFVGFVCQHEIQ